MRIFCAVLGFLGVIGFAGSANAGATIDLIWDGTGTSNIDVVSSSVFVQLNIVYTNDEFSIGAIISVDYANMLPDFSVDHYTSNPGAGSAPLPLSPFITTDTGTQVQNIQAQ